MSPILYTFDASPACRTIYMVAKEIGIELQLKIINPIKGEHLNPDFIKLNPRHTVPTLIDDDLILTDSHSISSYLIGKYAKSDYLYPKDINKKVLVDQMLHFDSSVTFNALVEVTKPLLREPQKGLTPTGISATNAAYNFLNKFLEGKEWVALNHPTIADFHLVTTATTLNNLISYAGNLNIESWVKRCQTLNSFDVNLKGNQDYIDAFTPLIKYFLMFITLF